MMRIKRSLTLTAAKQLVQILENGNICFTGRKLSIDLPANQTKRQNLIHAGNTFIDYLSHRRGHTFGHLRGF